MNAALPSEAGPLRDRRIRAIRRVLDDHQATDIGCACGWVRRPGITGKIAHRDHVAERVVDV